ncbi:unnamed protein product [Protopolystoma xenopodis]|uniref:Uncharacterized protein n=1 Tax=Protopolystoma xenopodis TaxID=117903 RepID=A0A448X916_9PLAT|nr:unnamed protein product [Protopolystoma xenopodis]
MTQRPLHQIAASKTTSATGRSDMSWSDDPKQSAKKAHAETGSQMETEPDRTPSEVTIFYPMAPVDCIGLSNT